MSHINEALKKAQKERDVRFLTYGGILAASGRKKSILSGKTIWWAFPLILVIFLAFFHDSWLDFTASQTPETFEKDQERFQSTPKGTGAVKPREIGLRKRHETIPSKPEQSGLNKRQGTDSGRPEQSGLNKRQGTDSGRPEQSGLNKRQGTDSGRPEQNGLKKLQVTDSGKPGNIDSKEYHETILGRSEETYNRARQFHKEGRLEEAKRLYEETLQLDPGYVDALNNLGVIFIGERDDVAARRSLEKAVRLKPRYAEPFYNLACLNAIRGDIKLALAQLKKAVSLDPTVRDWARKDTDLDSLRHLPEFRELI
jgi:tetratricopeptide (TPR) repeat protein